MKWEATGQGNQTKGEGWLLIDTNEDIRKDYVQINVLANEVKNLTTSISELKTEIKDMKTEFKECYITKTEFDPIKRIVYGVVGLLLVAIAGAIIKLVILP